MTARRHRRHPTELKIHLAESYLNGEGSLKEIAKAHDISHNLLMIWADKYRRGELSDEVDFVEKQRTYEAHIAALERKIGQLTMEVDALQSRRPAEGLIHHSDRGSQYAAKPYRERLELHGIRGSMSRKGNPHDNAKAESFMKTLKHEEVLMAGYRDLADVQQRLFRFVDEVQRAPYSLRARIPAPQRVRTNALPPSGQSLST